jgi:hypothetical protein
MRTESRLAQIPGATLKRELWKKHIHGQKKYHAFSFIADGRIMKKETIEELIDGINYLVYQLIKDRFKKEEILTWDEKKLNVIYLKILEEIDKMDSESRNKSIRAIARMRDLIKYLS